MKKTIYISIPMTGRTDDEIYRDINTCISYAQDILSGAGFDLKFLTPKFLAVEALDIKNYLSFKNDKRFPPDAPTYSEFMGYDICKIIGEADMIVFDKNYELSKGCRLEMAAAEIYKKQIIICPK